MEPLYNKNQWYSFWHWLLKGYGGKPGYKSLLSYWLVSDIILSFLFSKLVSAQPSEMAVAILLPLMGVLIGLAIVCCSSAYAVIITDEINLLAEKLEAGPIEYVYPYNLSLLIILITAGYWAFAALGLLDFHYLEIGNIWIGEKSLHPYKIIGFFLISNSVRLSWQSLRDNASLALAVNEVRFTGSVMAQFSAYEAGVGSIMFAASM